MFKIFKNIYLYPEGEVVNDTALSLVSTCQTNGLFSEITDWPGCRGAISCNTFPVPDIATTYLLPTQSQEVVEYEYALYSCKDGATLEGKVNTLTCLINGQGLIKGQGLNFSKF